MGYIKHHTIVVTGWQQKIMDDIHAFAVGKKLVVSPVMVSPTNGYLTICIAPDGSKEGWQSSNQGNLARAALIAYMKAQHSVSWFEAAYSPDDCTVNITDSSYATGE